jgi:hypothetical protein
MFLCVALLTVTAVAADKFPMAQGDKAACGGEWVPLFNGADLTGWQNARDAKGENQWYVEDGALTNKEHANDIGTVEQFKNFCVQLKYKINPHGNSGTYLRGRVEIQILDSHGKEALETGDDGGIYSLFAPAVNASKPAGEWNELMAVFIGNRLTAVLNGQVVQKDIEIGKVTGGALPGGVTDAGPFMLQGDHGKVWFRDIMVKKLPDCDEEAKAACAGKACCVK